MHRRTLMSAIMASPILCRQAWADRPMAVVATFSILADMARQVGGPAVSVISLVPPDADTHVYEPKPSDLRALKEAKMVVMNGLGLDTWMERLLGAAGYAGPVVIATDGVSARKMREPDHGGTEETDPHAWQDPRNGIIYASNIAEGLAKANPAHAADFRVRAEEFGRRIAETDTWIEQQFAPIPLSKRKILTSHDAFGYFGARYQIEFHGVEGISSESESSAAEIAALVKLVRKEGIKAVFVENMTNSRLAKTVARESGAILGPTVYSDALSPPGGPADTYLKMLRYNAPLFAGAMRAN